MEVSKRILNSFPNFSIKLSYSFSTNLLSASFNLNLSQFKTLSLSVYSSLLKVSSDIYSTLPKMFRNDGIEATEIFNHVSKICAGMESKNYLEKYDINGDRTLKKYTQDKP